MSEMLTSLTSKWWYVKIQESWTQTFTNPQARLLKTNAKAQFIDVTQAKSSVATRYLEQADWNVEEALREYYNENPPYDPKLEKLFDKYMDSENHDLILIDGTLAYLNDLGIDPEEV